MTTVKVKFRPSTVEGRPGTIVYFVTHRRVVRQITTGYKVFPHEWDDKRSRPVATPEGERTAVIQAVAQRIRRDMNRLDKIINGLNSGKRAFATDEIVRLFHETEREASFFEFMAEVILQLERLGKERTAENYTTALNSFKRFRNGNDIMLNEIDSDLMTEYEAYLKSHDVAMNTVSFYNRILRAVYNRAVEKEMTVQRYPFKHVYTGIDKTVKRALPLKIIRRITGPVAQVLIGFCKGHVSVLILHTRNVVHRHGISQEEGFAERHPFLSQTKDGAAIIHQVGKIHAGDYRQIPGK